MLKSLNSFQIQLVFLFTFVDISKKRFFKSLILSVIVSIKTFALTRGIFPRLNQRRFLDFFTCVSSQALKFIFILFVHYPNFVLKLVPGNNENPFYLLPRLFFSFL